ncbi:MAG TPA: TIGR02253 family HAD-type hydrolase [Candidatus Diapherotrites archaeon]|uniref:Glyceraldehyde 3-phosphate phosphatase n=1 Tax=Candidatus Iainarchaeum sp. TaxID=3101447 RepID=A0A7J4IW55_9ARCH|nr:TIGR02253 family HAD-type hydrolase [Candidatus Diapherotrites archaeon]
MKAVIFDLDNTLIDFMRMKKISCEAAIAAMIDAGLQMDKDKAYKKLFELYGVHGIEHQEIFQEFLKKVSGKIDYRILSRGINAYRKMQVGYLEPYPHVRSTLIALKKKGLRLAIVSDAPKLKAWMRLTEMGIADFFDVVVTLDDTGKAKPHAMPFKAAVKELSCAPAEILFVGDNPARDIKGAKDAGMKTALAKYGQIFPANGISADYELNDIADLIKKT